MVFNYLYYLKNKNAINNELKDAKQNFIKKNSYLRVNKNKMNGSTLSDISFNNMIVTSNNKKKLDLEQKINDKKYQDSLNNNEETVSRELLKSVTSMFGGILGNKFPFAIDNAKYTRLNSPKTIFIRNKV